MNTTNAPRLFKASDTVRHVPTKEIWVLACDEEDNKVMPSGWPMTVAEAQDCVLLSEDSSQGHTNMLQNWAHKTSTDAQSDPRVLTARRQLGLVSSMTANNLDKLDILFKIQRELNFRCGVDTNAMSEADRAKWIQKFSLAMTQELAELVDSTPWKWWAKYQTFDEQNAKVEVVDLFHFLISLAQTLGMSADDLYMAYLKKNEVNHKRQDSNYTGKDPNDSKHI